MNFDDLESALDLTSLTLAYLDLGETQQLSKILEVALLCTLEVPNLKVNAKGLECTKRLLFGMFKQPSNADKVGLLENPVLIFSVSLQGSTCSTPFRKNSKNRTILTNA